MEGGEGGEGGINGKNKFEEKIPVGNKLNIPLKTNLNSNMVEFGKLSDRRKARWLGRGSIVYVNEYGKRRVSWDSVKGGKQAGKWVISNTTHNKNVGLGPAKQNAQALWGNKEPILGLGLSSPSNFETGESSFSGPRALETSYQNGFTMPSSGRSDNIATKDIESSRSTPTTSEHLATSPKVLLGMYSSSAASEVVGNAKEDSTIALAQPPTASTGPTVVAQASHVQISPISDLNGSKLMLVVSSATISKPVMTLADPKVSTMVSLSSLVASEDGDENFVGSKGLGTSVFEGAQVPGPTIRELVGDIRLMVK